jgi:hypothetical protein
MEPFEVDEPIQFANKKEDLRERFQKIRFQAPSQGAAKVSANRAASKDR